MSKSMNRYVGFGRPPRLRGEYDKRSVTHEAVDKFCENGGDSFWAIVHGQHAVLVCMAVLGRTVSNADHRMKDSAFRDPIPGEEVLVVVPEKEFVEWMDGDVDDYERTREVPIPECSLEIWTRRK